MRLRKRRVEGCNLADRLVDEHSDGHALAFVDPLGVIEHVTYVQVAVQAARWADLLRTNGVGPGDRVLVLAGLEREWRSGLLGVLEAGAAAVPFPASAPLDEILDVADSAAVAIIVSASPRPELSEGHGFVVLTPDKLHAAVDPDETIHSAMPDDVALVLYERDADGFHGALHTHPSLLSQAIVGAHWLDVARRERIWTTAVQGSIESIWVLLAAWRVGAEIVEVDAALPPEERLELMTRLQPTAVWLSDDEYGALATANIPPWTDLRSIKRALTAGAPAQGAAAFSEVFRIPLAPVYGAKETGVFAGCAASDDAQAPSLTGIGVAIVDEAGTELAPGREGELALPGDAPTLFAGYAGFQTGEQRSSDWFRLGRRGAIDPDGFLRLGSGVVPRLEPAAADLEPDFTAEVAVLTSEPVVAEDEPKADARAGERRRKEEAKQAKRREEQEAKAAREREKLEKQRLREEAKERERAEAEERRLAEEAERTERRRRSEEAALAESAAAEERRRALEVERDGLIDERRRAQEELRRRDAFRRHEEIRLEAERERLAPDILSRIDHYGATPDPDSRRESSTTIQPAAAAEADERLGD